MQLDGSCALVAGGASGLGAATVRKLHGGGADVVIADTSQQRGRELAAELGPRARFVRTDVTDEDDVQRAVQAAAEIPGGLRVAVCCAGIAWAERVAGRRGPHALQPFERVLAVNAVGTFNVMRLAAACMIASGDDREERGVVVNTASIAAFDGQIGQLAYAASKGAIVAMTLAAARDLAEAGIRVCTIAPGTFDTPLLAALPESAREALAQTIPFPRRLGRPEEFASLVVEVIENPMLNGEVIRLDGALRMPPR